ncbi:hypothetical protein NF417_12955, partial [Streptococcus suis]|nr:hypothetical protein [Streptococcus suis]
NHIIASNELSVSRASIYRYLEKGYLSTKPIDFPRVVKFRKRRIEKNHTLIRDILPKGSSFDNLTQEDINLVCSHVNSVKRAS